ncbi:unnamed protein product [Arctogadus glacialis]
MEEEPMVEEELVVEEAVPEEETTVGMNPVQIETGEFDEAIQIEEDFPAESLNTNILTLTDKVNAFTKKLQRWAVRAEGSGDFEMFSELHDFLEEEDTKSFKNPTALHDGPLLEPPLQKKGKVCEIDEENNSPMCVCQDPSSCLAAAGEFEHVCGTDKRPKRIILPLLRHQVRSTKPKQDQEGTQVHLTTLGAAKCVMLL